MRVRLFANSVAAAICEFPSALFVNEFSAPKEETKIRWAMLAPFGDWPNKQGMQRVTKEDAQAIVNEFEKPANVLKRKVGIPFYIGHPDHPDFKDRYRDTKAYGRIKEMEVRDDGLWGGIKFNGEGEKIIADEAFDGHSVNWFLRPDPKEKGIWRPFKVKSAGFTNEPNLPVPPITTANETQQETIFKRLARLRLFCNQSEKKADESMADRVKLSAQDIKLGAEARKDYKAGNNPPSWVEDEATWEKAKDAALKTYDETDDFFWAAVTHIYENMGGEVGGANEGTTEGAHKGAVVKHGTVKAREKFQAAKDRAKESTNAANAASATAAANGGKAHEAAKAAHGLAAEHHVEAGHRAKALGMADEAEGHFSAANGHRQQFDKHVSEMMNGGMDMDEAMINSRFRKLAAMRKGKTSANAANEVAMDDIRQQLQSQMVSNSKFKKTRPNGNCLSDGGYWITDLFAPEGKEGWTLVVQLGDNKYYRAGFTLDGGTATLSDSDPVEVQRSVSFKPVKK